MLTFNTCPHFISFFFNSCVRVLDYKKFLSLKKLAFDCDVFLQQVYANNLRSRFLKNCITSNFDIRGFFLHDKTIGQNLKLFGSIFVSNGRDPFSVVKQFELGRDVLDKKLNDLTEREICLISFFPVLLKKARVIFVEFSEISLTSEDFQRISAMISVLAVQNKSIVFYHSTLPVFVESELNY